MHPYRFLLQFQYFSAAASFPAVHQGWMQSTTHQQQSTAGTLAGELSSCFCSRLHRQHACSMSVRTGTDLVSVLTWAWLWDEAWVHYIECRLRCTLLSCLHMQRTRRKAAQMPLCRYFAGDWVSSCRAAVLGHTAPTCRGCSKAHLPPYTACRILAYLFECCSLILVPLTGLRGGLSRAAL